MIEANPDQAFTVHVFDAGSNAKVRANNFRLVKIPIYLL